MSSTDTVAALPGPGRANLTTQQRILVDLLSKGTTLTNKVALVCYGIGSLTSRIAELRRLGYDIQHRTEEDQDGRRFRKYDKGDGWAD